VKNPLTKEGKFNPNLYPRSYGPQFFYRALGCLFAFLTGVVVLSVVSGHVQSPSGLVGSALFIFFGATMGRDAYAPTRVVLNEASITVTRRFSKTLSVQRKDIVGLELTIKNMFGEFLAIEHRDPNVAQIKLVNLNWDEDFWLWFTGIPAEIRRGD
jgi:hypothetical protein